MTDKFEDELRRALRGVDPPAGFAERVMRALPAQSAPATVTPLATPKRIPPPLRRFGMPTALAASLIVAVLFGQHAAQDRALRDEAAGRAASLEFMQALRVTSQKLDLAYQAVKTPPTAVDEENRS